MFQGPRTSRLRSDSCHPAGDVPKRSDTQVGEGLCGGLHHLGVAAQSELTAGGQTRPRGCVCPAVTFVAREIGQVSKPKLPGHRTRPGGGLGIHESSRHLREALARRRGGLAGRRCLQTVGIGSLSPVSWRRGGTESAKSWRSGRQTEVRLTWFAGSTTGMRTCSSRSRTLLSCAEAPQQSDRLIMNSPWAGSRDT